jgi:hypothetical protein
MNMVFIYGAPGVGKLTVATELAQRTGYRLLDNHVTIDWARRFFDFGTAPFWRLDERLKLAVIDEALKENLDLILTFVRPSEDHARRLDAEVAATGGHSLYVHLVCSRPELERRLQASSRELAGKLTNVDALGRMLDRQDLLSALPGRNDQSSTTAS